MRFGRVSMLAVVTMLLCGPTIVGQTRPGAAQNGPPSRTQLSDLDGSSNREKADPAIASMQQTQMKMRNDDRQKRLVADTEKLLQLATQLHADVAKTDKNILSMDVIKRAEEIEKLAHNVKERMKG